MPNKKIIEKAVLLLIIGLFNTSNLLALDYPKLALLITDIGLNRQQVRDIYKNQGDIVNGNEPNSLAIKSGNAEMRTWLFNSQGRCTESTIIIGYDKTMFSDFVSYWRSHGYNLILAQQEDKSNAVSAIRLASINNLAYIEILDYQRAKVIELSVTSATGSPYDVIPFLGEWDGRSSETGQFHTLTFTIGANNKIFYQENRILRGAKVLIEQGEIDLFPDMLYFWGTSTDISRRWTFTWKFENESLVLRAGQNAQDSIYTRLK
jgi:hypothetical protein